MTETTATGPKSEVLEVVMTLQRCVKEALLHSLLIPTQHSYCKHTQESVTLPGLLLIQIHQATNAYSALPAF